ncbi:hypothetical protein HMPREF3038_01055 [Akkermansia sp. KLE1797]|nr:hypothetical protein HMPREF3038_01055 [Akkermansia sp. KLE1797]KZA05045.1 hypothetical protein HMPREF1326_01263 [Akkermansia sp. KLE1605]
MHRAVSLGKQPADLLPFPCKSCKDETCFYRCVSKTDNSSFFLTIIETTEAFRFKMT